MSLNYACGVDADLLKKVMLGFVEERLQQRIECATQQREYYPNTVMHFADLERQVSEVAKAIERGVERSQNLLIIGAVWLGKISGAWGVDVGFVMQHAGMNTVEKRIDFLERLFRRCTYMIPAREPDPEFCGMLTTAYESINRDQPLTVPRFSKHPSSFLQHDDVDVLVRDYLGLPEKLIN